MKSLVAFEPLVRPHLAILVKFTVAANVIRYL